jgi:hypothetical protein
LRVEPIGQLRRERVRHPRFDGPGQAGDGLQVDAEDESARSHFAGGDLEPSSGSRTEVEDASAGRDNPKAALDLV